MRKMIKEWRRQHWGDLAVLRYGRALRTHRDATAGYPVFGTNGPIGWHSEPLFPPGVIVGRKGAYRGIHYARQGCWIIDTAFYLDIQDPQVDSRWAYYQLKTVNLNAIDSGSAIPSTTRPAFAAIPVSVPPLATQKSVVAVLDALDDLIENNRRRIEVLEQMAQAIYREWFVHFRYSGHDDVPLVDSPLGPIPDGWGVKPFTELASFVNGFAFKPKHWGTIGRPIIKIKQLKEGVAASTPRCDHSTIDSKYWVEAGDLLFSWSADLGVYRWSGAPGLLNQHLFVVTPTGQLPISFMYHSLADAIPQFWKRAQGTTMRHIKRAALTQVSAVVPHRQVVEAFDVAAEPMAQEVIRLRLGMHWLNALRDRLLPKLVTGEIDVSDLDLNALAESVA